ncbi:putative phosphate transport regulator [Trichococcus palustris]|uniref:Putative phosphate transport regulator n=1 Tax=Trichococcus palustris TaxID=140314 RepID=A0A143YPK0_9LACT|nr:DUF47 family protein [Trichococcus palustris]CZQ95304.1 putative phosphate transport regulator [Trichococcus palustris]SFK96267.1 hypothetical protein SAMN04488076_1112 [Trichococcus palustris]
MLKKKKDTLNYFDEFIKVSELTIQSAQFLKEALTDYRIDELNAKVDEMHVIENQADHQKHALIAYLYSDFLPPIGREDIVALANGLDNTVDLIEDVLIQIEMYHLENITPEMAAFLDLVEKCAHDLNLAFKEFKNYKKSKLIHDIIIRINEHEKEGDKLYIHAVRELYKETDDVVGIIVLTKIYEKFEKCCDAFEDIANLIEEVVLKNS